MMAVSAAITAVLCAFGSLPPIDTPAARHCGEATCSVVPWGLTVESNSWDKDVSHAYLQQCMTLHMLHAGLLHAMAMHC
jgi:hypothetical protein